MISRYDAGRIAESIGFVTRKQVIQVYDCKGSAIANGRVRGAAIRLGIEPPPKFLPEATPQAKKIIAREARLLLRRLVGNDVLDERAKRRVK